MDAVRTCVGCRERDKRERLLRIVVRDSILVIDEKGGLPGRGSHVHDREACLQQAIVRRAFSRALRVATQVDTTQIENRLQKMTDN